MYELNFDIETRVLHRGRLLFVRSPKTCKKKHYICIYIAFQRSDLWRIWKKGPYRISVFLICAAVRVVKYQIAQIISCPITLCLNSRANSHKHIFDRILRFSNQRAFRNTVCAQIIYFACSPTTSGSVRNAKIFFLNSIHPYRNKSRFISRCKIREINEKFSHIKAAFFWLPRELEWYRESCR